jgi:hypothetical protein
MLGLFLSTLVSSDTSVQTSGTEREAEEGRCCFGRGADFCSGYFLLFIFVSP